MRETVFTASRRVTGPLLFRSYSLQGRLCIMGLERGHWQRVAGDSGLSLWGLN